MIIWINYNVFSNFVIRNIVGKARLNMIDQYYFIPCEYNLLSPHNRKFFYAMDFLLLGNAKNPRNYTCTICIKMIFTRCDTKVLEIRRDAVQQLSKKFYYQSFKRVILNNYLSHCKFISISR